MAGKHTGSARAERGIMSLFERSRTARRRSWRPLAAAPLVAMLALTVAACGGGMRRPPAGTPEPDKFLFELGTENLDKRRWLVSRESFRELIDTYPQSRYRADAKLGVGDTYLGEGSAESYVLALNEYREFIAYYPTHPRVDYAQYKLGMTHFYQMQSADRDQTETREAIRELTLFVERYPTSALLEEGKARLREARDRLSQYEYNVGYHYYRSKWYPGAVDRFRVLLEKDPEFTNRDAVYFYLGESFMKVGRPAEALPYYDRLVKEFEQSEHLLEAQKRIDEIKAEPAIETKK
jgi:outer membrane protein assembly factor BamD